MKEEEHDGELPFPTYLRSPPLKWFEVCPLARRPTSWGLSSQGCAGEGPPHLRYDILLAIFSKWHTAEEGACITATDETILVPLPLSHDSIARLMHRPNLSVNVILTDRSNRSEILSISRFTGIPSLGLITERIGYNAIGYSAKSDIVPTAGWSQFPYSKKYRI